MEDGTKKDSAQCKEPVFLDKAGWMKKDTGRLLASYKDRYIHVEKTTVVVYENEDLKNCLERLDLENYDSCHELKSPFKKRHRLILIQSPKSGNKVHAVKFQAQTAEEKEAWIKALSDGINRAKNKVFDEVNTNESRSLEHVTRTRPKGNRNRRPPTRIHMKEIAVASSDGILRLDLDFEDAFMQNGSQNASVNYAETSKEATQVPIPLSNTNESTKKQLAPSVEDEQPESEIKSRKKIIKPPMPPTKGSKPTAKPEEETDGADDLMKKVENDCMPPSEEAKLCNLSEEDSDKAETEKMSEKNNEARKKTNPVPVPPNKPNSSKQSSTRNLAEATSVGSNPRPPTPPSKEKKPSHPYVEPDQEVQKTTHEIKELPCVQYDEAQNPSAQEQVSQVETQESISSGTNKFSVIEPLQPTVPLSGNCKPHSTEEQDPSTFPQAATDSSAISPQVKEALPQSEGLLEFVSSNDLVTNSLNLSPVLCCLHEEKKKKVEEKSVNGSQYLDDDSEGSGSKDILATSTVALRGSHAGLDALDANKDDIQICGSFKDTQALAKSEESPCQLSEPTPPLKPSTKAGSTSFEDLKPDCSVCPQIKEHTNTAAENDSAPRDDVIKPEAEVFLELEKTSEVLSRAEQFQRGGDKEGIPENLLGKAMEKLNVTDCVFREVKKLKFAKDSIKRNSW